jgi:lipopolysaccharide/colanic/teichoic acid biosynthesis glycosyltransferase
MLPDSKRWFDLLSAGVSLLAFCPLLSAVSLVVWVSDGSPIFFRQERVGRFGRRFRLIKFRTMSGSRTEEEGSFHAGDLTRVTPLGKILRRTKLDELPQLWNVLLGDMSLVGPRPEVPEWVAVYPDRWKIVLQVRPGITDHASILFRHEEDLLARAEDPIKLYRDRILPQKLDLYEEYVRSHSFVNDLRIIARTFSSVFGCARSEPSPRPPRPL